MLLRGISLELLSAFCTGRQAEWCSSIVRKSALDSDGVDRGGNGTRFIQSTGICYMFNLIKSGH